MAYTSEEARQQLLDELASAIDQLALALAALGEAYDLVDEGAADMLERELFRPVQGAYGRARRTRAEFAERHGFPGRAFEPGSPGLHSADPRVHVERAADAVEQADHVIAEMQDSMLPVEVGDLELRQGLTQTREQISAVPARGRQFIRTIGR